MECKGIITDRKFNKWPSWDIVYEWEDVFAEQMQVPLRHPIVSKFLLNRYTTDFFSREATIRTFLAFDRLVNYKKVWLYFEMYPQNRYFYSVRPDVLPIIVDYWKSTDIRRFNFIYQNCKAVLISSLEVYNYLKSNGCSLNIHHLPLSLPDKYASVYSGTKKYDIVLPGRTNKVLLSFVEQFAAEHPMVEYIYQEKVDGTLCYRSNQRGLIGSFHSRQEYLQLLRDSRIAFYSTPGIDGGDALTGGFNPVTPRLLELISANCSLIGRYPDNEETKFYEMEHICPNVASYEEFASLLSDYLDGNNHRKEYYDSYLQQHRTSARVDSLKKILELI